MLDWEPSFKEEKNKVEEIVERTRIDLKAKDQHITKLEHDFAKAKGVMEEANNMVLVKQQSRQDTFLLAKS